MPSCASSLASDARPTRASRITETAGRRYRRSSSRPRSPAFPDGGFLIAEQYSGRVRRVWADGTITTVAGAVAPWKSKQPASARRGDGGRAPKATIEPVAVATTSDGGYLVLEPARVRKVTADG